MPPTSPTTSRQRSPSVLASLRALVPERRLSFFEARRLSELQAKRLRHLLGVLTPELPEEAIPSLPRLSVVELPDLDSSGSASWSDGRWIIAINGLEPWQRQRFSLGHELWHVINHETVARLCPGDRFTNGDAQAEQLADYFSGCLHMPGQDVRRLVREGYDLEALAHLFGVSTRAVAVRLSQLRIDRQPRCGQRASRSWRMNK